MLENNQKKSLTEQGFTVTELLVSMVILVIVVVSFFGLYASLVTSSRYTKLKSVALTLATNHMEYLKSLPYDRLAVAGGNIVAPTYLTQTVTKTIDGFIYTIKNDIDYADDSFDGCASYPTVAIAQALCRNYPAPSGSPVDSNPKDYKVLDVTVTQGSGKQLAQVSTGVSSRVAETSTNTGALVVTVLDDQGNPVSNAQITVSNTTVTPSINQSDNTDVNGTAIFYDLTPDTTNYDYVVTASKSEYSSLTTIPPTSTLQPYFPNQQIISQQSSLLGLVLRPKATNSLILETVNTNGTALSGMRVYLKGGYKRYNSTTDTTYYYDGLTPSDTRPTTDTTGQIGVQDLTPGEYIFCGDTGMASCTVGSTTYRVAAAVPYGGDNSLSPIIVPTYSAASPPTASFSYGVGSFVQKVRLYMTTNSSYPRLKTISPDEVSLLSGTAGNFTFSLTGNNLTCDAVAASCATSVVLRKGGSTFTASCTGDTTGLQIYCTVDLSAATTGQTGIDVTVGGQTLSIPESLKGGVYVAP